MGFASPLSPTSPGGALGRVNSIDYEDFSWTAGGEEYAIHRKMIAVGGYGEVHRVSHSMVATNSRCSTKDRILYYRHNLIIDIGLCQENRPAIWNIN